MGSSMVGAGSGYWLKSLGSRFNGPLSVVHDPVELRFAVIPAKLQATQS